MIKDGWVELGKQDTVDFTLPDTVDLDGQGILAFMLALKHAEETHLRVSINDTEVYNWTFREGNRYMAIHEVLGGDVLRAGQNTVKVEAPSGSYEFVQVSDIVLWWQAKAS